MFQKVFEKTTNIIENNLDQRKRPLASRSAKYIVQTTFFTPPDANSAKLYLWGIIMGLYCENIIFLVKSVRKWAAADFFKGFLS